MVQNVLTTLLQMELCPSPVCKMSLSRDVCLSTVRNRKKREQSIILEKLRTALFFVDKDRIPFYNFTALFESIQANLERSFDFQSVQVSFVTFFCQNRWSEQSVSKRSTLIWPIVCVAVFEFLPNGTFNFQSVHISYLYQARPSNYKVLSSYRQSILASSSDEWKAQNFAFRYKFVNHFNNFKTTIMKLRNV